MTRTLGPLPAYGGKDVGYVGCIECGGRLIENEEARLAAHGAGNFDQLALANGEIFEMGCRVEILQTDSVESCAAFGFRYAPANAKTRFSKGQFSTTVRAGMTLNS